MNARRRFIGLVAAPLAVAAEARLRPRRPRNRRHLPPRRRPAGRSSGRRPGEVVKRRYGAQLEGGDLDEIKKNIEDNLQAADRLKKALKLTNADEPVTLFHAVPPVPAGR
jgi:hypothetical protein